VSDRVRALIWDFYDQRRFGAPMVLALALSDEADDRGTVQQSHLELAKKTRQSERAIRQQMRALEGSGLVECAERSAGGAGKFNRYQLNLGLLVTANNPERGAGLTRNVVPGFDANNPERGAGFEELPLISSKDNVSSASPCRVDDDLRLAAWMFDRIKALNPKHRQPHYTTWTKDIRKMRERDKRTRREIAELFAWANAHPFWQANVLSPGTLRRQWERLELQRLRDGGTQSGIVKDTRCSWAKDGGTRCEREGVYGRPDGRRFCAEHQEAEERERASA
jgi:hypothetical protein